jgi:thioredoxin-like negative regulator of GroEL
MKPIVHGLEKQYNGKLDVLYFDISDAKTSDVQRKLKFSSTPHLILLKKNGERVTEWIGVTPEEKLKGAIEALLKERR